MQKSITAAQLATKINAQVVGNQNATATGISSLKEATPSDVAFLGNKKYTDQLAISKAAFILVDSDVTQHPIEGQAFLICSDPTLAFSAAIEYFAPPAPHYAVGIHASAIVHPSAKIGQNVSIGPCCVVSADAQIGDHTILVAQVFIGEGAQLGKDNLIYSNVSIRERCILGDRVIIHCSSVIGSDGFGFAPGPQGIVKIPQVGIVHLEDDVEIGACVTIDRARFGKTHLKKMVKVDNLVQIAHNVVIGEYSMIIAQVGIAGSSILEQNVIMAGQSSCAGHLTIGAGSKVGGTAALSKGCPPNSILFGAPAEPQRNFVARLMLPRQLEKLEKRVKELETKLNSNH